MGYKFTKRCAGSSESGSSYKGEFSYSETYNIGDIVTYGGDVYLVNSIHPDYIPSFEYYGWQKLNGEQFKGEYEQYTQYNEGDIVTCNGNVYRFTTASIGVPPEYITDYAEQLNAKATKVKIHISEFDSTYPLRFMYEESGSIHTETVDSSKIGTDIYLPCDVMFFAEVNDQNFDPYGNGLFYHADGRMTQEGEYQTVYTYYDGQLVGMFISAGLTADTYYLKLM